MSLSDDIRRLHADGRPRDQIARDLGAKDRTVYRVVYRLEKGIGPQPWTLTLSPQAHAPLALAAARRKIKTREIVARILEAMAADPTLIDNVLDDGD